MKGLGINQNRSPFLAVTGYRELIMFQAMGGCPYINTVNPYSNPNEAGVITTPFYKWENWKQQEAGPGVGVGDKSCRTHTRSTKSIPLLCRSTLRWGKSIWCTRQKQKHQQIKPDCCGKKKKKTPSSRLRVHVKREAEWWTSQRKWSLLFHWKASHVASITLSGDFT